MIHSRSNSFTVCLLLGLFVVCGCQGNAPTDQPHRNGEFIAADLIENRNDETAKNEFPPAYQDHFAPLDGKVIDGQYVPLELTKQEIIGRNAWMLWTGGNELFWDWLSRNGYGSIDLLKVIDSDQRDTRFKRAGLITEPGMRAPTAEETEASYGIRYDRPDQKYAPNAEGNDGDGKDSDSAYSGYREPDPNVYGYRTGVLGFRIFKNPDFQGSAIRKWNAERFYNDPVYASNPSTVKPYVVGISCASCHVSMHPLNPPEDPENPKWENLSATIGNQYLRVREVFGGALQKDSYLYHVMDSQFPGTIDTSLIASDNINNANTMNAIFGLQARVERALNNPAETLTKASYGPQGDHFPGLWSTENSYSSGVAYPAPFREFKAEFEYNPRRVPRVLVDGSDSLGSWIALARVYLNIGTYHQQWMRTHNTILGLRPQDPFTLADCESNSLYWHATKIRIDPMTAYFLKSTDPMLLKDAIAPEHVQKFSTTPDMELTIAEEKKRREKHGAPAYEFVGEPMDPAFKRARQVFAKGCIACHSSIQPDDRRGKLKGLEGVPDAKRLRLADLERLTHGDGELPDDYQKWARHVVNREEFWKDNYLSTDMRIPVTITETNSGRAMATNAIHGNVWEDFASLTFKELDSVGRIRYRDPFSGSAKSYPSPAGGPGYYRVPTLISAWATAPFFHNNALGNFTNDPSVKGRLDAFHDAMTKLLWPEKRFEISHDIAKGGKTGDAADPRSPEDLRSDGGLIWRTPNVTTFQILGHQIPSLLAGFTGWKRVWVRLLPWWPSFVFLIVGVLLILGQPITVWVEKVLRKIPQLKPLFQIIKWNVIIVLAVIGTWVLFKWYKFYSVLQLVEVGSGWYFPWLRVQVFLIGILLALTAIAFIFRKMQISTLAGIVFLLAAVVFGIGFGRFASGGGGNVALGPFPKGMPVNLISNMDPGAPLKDRIQAFKALTHYFQTRSGEPDKDDLKDFEQDVAPHLQAVSKCPDLVLDRGHDYEFIRQLTDDEKTELIELIKTF